ncbi:MAG: hypothetical protein KDA77_14255 [Planctomycetaceae bacterium]|nr:hypothetical protein [Planctomycetaceae bacterium]
MIRVNRPVFSPGTILATPNALDQVPQHEMRQALARHVAGDRGDCCPEDAEANDAALKSGKRLLSVYHTADRIKFWIITVADRSATNILLPEDY